MTLRTTDNPLVSVLVPLYNAKDYLAECLDSIIHQTYKNIEVIIINDGSTDCSLSIAMDYANKYEWIKVYSQQNSGASSARNKAFSFAKGDYIQYLDSDDFLSPDKIALQMQELSMEQDSTLCFGKCARFEKNNHKIDQKTLKINKDYTDPCSLLETMWLTGEVIYPHAYLTHRSLIEASKGWNEELSNNDDGEFFARIILLSSKIIFVSNSISYYRTDAPNSLSKGISHKSLLSLKKSMNLYVEHSKKCKKDFSKALTTMYTLTLIKLYPLDPALAKEVEIEKEQFGITGFRYPKKTKLYVLLFLFLGIKTTALVHHKLLVLRNFTHNIKDQSRA